MKIGYTKRALKALERLPVPVRKSFLKQVGYLVHDPRHPSLRAKKYDEAEDLWQARVNRDWRFYFVIRGDVCIVTNIIPHPK
jgi:mRNA interferase RelE/StbE